MSRLPSLAPRHSFGGVDVCIKEPFPILEMFIYQLKDNLLVWKNKG